MLQFALFDRSDTSIYSYYVYKDTHLHHYTVLLPFIMVPKETYDKRPCFWYVFLLTVTLRKLCY